MRTRQVRVTRREVVARQQRAAEAWLRRQLEGLGSKARRAARELGRPRCQICGIVGHWYEARATCKRCKATVHDVCYWGRVASLAEWLEFQRQLAEGPDTYTPEVVCPSCRLRPRKGRGKGKEA